MTEEHAEHFAQFIKDHDKRFEAKARPEGLESSVLLTQASDGTVLEPIVEVEAYREAQIEQNDPGPTVREAWEKWRLSFNGK